MNASTRGAKCVSGRPWRSPRPRQRPHIEVYHQGVTESPAIGHSVNACIQKTFSVNRLGIELATDANPIRRRWTAS
jgi:hypothetical protein